MRQAAAFGLIVLCGAAALQARQQPAAAAKADIQPLAAQAKRIVETLDHLGATLKAADRKTVLDAAAAMATATGTATIEKVLAPQSGAPRTPDIGGSASTSDLGKAIAEAL